MKKKLTPIQVKCLKVLETIGWVHSGSIDGRRERAYKALVEKGYATSYYPRPADERSADQKEENNA